MKRRRHNSVQRAAQLSEAFHGRPAQSVKDYVEELKEHSTLADLGKLLCVKLWGGITIRFDEDTRLASNEEGTQLFAVGGDQSIDLKLFPDVDATKESVVLGQIRDLEYETAKFHLGAEDRRKGPYVHRLGEEGGEMPLLCYDTVNELVSFVGGSYRIERDMDGKYSAGIRN